MVVSNISSRIASPVHPSNNSPSTQHLNTGSSFESHAAGRALEIQIFGVDSRLIPTMYGDTAKVANSTMERLYLTADHLNLYSAEDGPLHNNAFYMGVIAPRDIDFNRRENKEAVLNNYNWQTHTLSRNPEKLRNELLDDLQSEWYKNDNAASYPAYFTDQSSQPKTNITAPQKRQRIIHDGDVVESNILPSGARRNKPVVESVSLAAVQPKTRRLNQVREDTAAVSANNILNHKRGGEASLLQPIVSPPQKRQRIIHDGDVVESNILPSGAKRNKPDIVSVSIAAPQPKARRQPFVDDAAIKESNILGYKRGAEQDPTPDQQLQAEYEAYLKR